MAQMNFYVNANGLMGLQNFSLASTAISFFPVCLCDSISFGTLNFYGAGNETNGTLHVGLYSINNGTLSLANSISGTIRGTQGWKSLTGTSATQNVTPGNWWLGLKYFSGNTESINLMGHSSLAPVNAFQGAFIQGIMTVSTAALPTAYATSDLDITGADALTVPFIILTA